MKKCDNEMKEENDIYEKAWRLLNEIEDFSIELWEIFEQYFLQKCIDMDDEQYENRWKKNK